MTERPPESLLKQYLARRGHPGDGLGVSSDPEGAEDLGCFGWHRGIRDLPWTLELCMRDGSIVGLPYAIIERYDYCPCEGISLRLARESIRITGTNLNGEIRPGVRLFQGLVRRRVSWLRESAQHESLNGRERRVHIEHIESWRHSSPTSTDTGE